jgi:hypothetical protein
MKGLQPKCLTLDLSVEIFRQESSDWCCHAMRLTNPCRFDGLKVLSQPRDSRPLEVEG